MASTLWIIFLVGGIWFAVSSAISFVVSWLQWRRQHENPGHLVVLANLALSILYWYLFVDWNFFLRADGVEVPWLRQATEVLVFLVYSWMVTVSLWVDWDDAWVIVFLHTFAGALLLITNLVSAQVFWYGWAIAAATLLFAQIFMLRRSRRPDSIAWVLFAGWLVYAIGVPIVQALSWTMGEVFDNSPHRETSEIFYICVYAGGVSIYGWVQQGLFSMRPVDRPVVKLESPAIPEPGEDMGEPSAVIGKSVSSSGLISRRVKLNMQ